MTSEPEPPIWLMQLLGADTVWRAATSVALLAAREHAIIQGIDMPPMPADHWHRIYRMRLERLARLGVDMALWEECVDALRAASEAGMELRLFWVESGDVDVVVFTDSANTRVVGAFIKPTGDVLRSLHS